MLAAQNAVHKSGITQVQMSLSLHWEWGHQVPGASCESLQEYIAVWVQEKHISWPFYINVPSHLNVVQLNQFLIKKKYFKI